MLFCKDVGQLALRGSTWRQSNGDPKQITMLIWKQWF